MNPLVEIGIVILVGLGAFVMARASRLRYVAKFGPPPLDTKVRTFAFFSLVVGLLRSWVVVTAGFGGGFGWGISAVPIRWLPITALVLVAAVS